MKLGVSTACLYPEVPEIALDHLIAGGIRFFEIFLNTVSEVKPDFVRGLKSRLDSCGGEVRSIHPFTSGFETMMLFSDYRRRFLDALELHRYYFEAANILGASIFVLHGERDYRRRRITEQEYLERYAKLYELGKSFGITVAQENVNLFRSEDPAFIRNNGINHGAVSEKLGIYGSPAVAEDSLVARDCMIALHTGAAVNIQHISSACSVAMVRAAKKMGADVWAEVTPHHFTLTEDAVLEFGSFAKMNPPLRTEADRRALIEGLKDGTIDMIATDHAPHSAEEKARPLTEAPSGIIGLETALALGITELVRTGELTIAQLMEKMSFNPACLYHLEKGWLTEGEDADLVLFDENEEWTPGDYASKASNSPFTGWKLYGKVKYTICGGEIVYEDESAAD